MFTPPPQVCPGNHEAQFDFAPYLNRFTMPYNESNSSSPFYYSFDYGGVHFVMLDTEHDVSKGALNIEKYLLRF